jgi:hypothetical protein
MGTLSNQPIRATMDVSILGTTRYHEGNERRSNGFTFGVEERMGEVKEVAKKLGVSVAEVISLYDAMVRNRHCDLMARDGDIKDEQLAGFGDLLENGLTVLSGWRQENREGL